MQAVITSYSIHYTKLYDATGDDGYYEMGFVWPGTRWVANGDGTVTDHATGLMWVANSIKIVPDLSAQQIAFGASMPAGNQALAARGDWSALNSYAGGDLVAHEGVSYNFV